jgi:hypothetical protein
MDETLQERRPGRYEHDTHNRGRGDIGRLLFFSSRDDDLYSTERERLQWKLLCHSRNSRRDPRRTQRTRRTGNEEEEIGGGELIGVRDLVRVLDEGLFRSIGLPGIWRIWERKTIACWSAHLRNFRFGRTDQTTRWSGGLADGAAHRHQAVGVSLWIFKERRGGGTVERSVSVYTHVCIPDWPGQFKPGNWATPVSFVVKIRGERGGDWTDRGQSKLWQLAQL